MGIHTDIDPLDANDFDIDAAADADEMLDRVLKDFAREKFKEANETNRRLNGGEYVPYEVWIDGKKVHEGRGAFFPEHQISRIRRERTRRERNAEFGRRIGEILIEWILNKAEERAVAAAVRFAVNWLDPWTVSYAMQLGDYALQTARWARRIPGGDGPETQGDHVLQWIARELLDRSPVVSGAYRDAHALYADGRRIGSADEIARGGTAVPHSAEYVFVNPQPYARKIEVGKTREGRDFVVQVPNRIYERVAADAGSLFSDIADIVSEWRDESSMPAPTRSRSRSLRFPAIVITPR